MKKFISVIFKLILILLLLVSGIFAWGWVRSPIQPVIWTADANPGLVGDFAPNGRLDNFTNLTDGLGRGPEDIAVAADGAIFTGLEGGQIFRIDSDSGESTLFVDTQGRPLGMEFDANGSLIVADADHGLLRIDAQGVIEVLVGSDILLFVDDVDIASDGTIWFSNASQKYTYGQSLNSFLEGDLSGQIYSYSPETGKLTEQMSGLFFANGVALGPEEESLFVSETGHGRIHRLWIDGPKQGQRELFASGLPGVTDNLSFNGRDTVWVALPSLRAVEIAGSPGIRRILAGLPKEWWFPSYTVGFIVGFNLQGEVTHNLQFSNQGDVPFSDITSVTELNGKLYIGSLEESELAVLQLSN